MLFKKIKIDTEESLNEKRYAVYMVLDNKEHYVCDMIDADSAEAAATNELGLTLRARLTRSKGWYAMLEGTVFNPERLLDSACEITEYSTDEFKGGNYKDGFSLLTVTADNCVNKYFVFSDVLLERLLNKIKGRLVPKD